MSRCFSARPRHPFVIASLPMSRRCALFALFLCCIAASAPASVDRWPYRPAAGIDDCFAEHDAAFVLRHLESDRSIRVGGKRTAMQLSPCSTFKIPHALIGLECGVLTGADQRFPWDGGSRLIRDWQRDHSLRSSMYYSVVPVYQWLASQIGLEREAHWLSLFDYGNRDLSAGLTTFWLGTSLQISANEQAAFLRKLLDRQLPVASSSHEIVRAITCLERFDDGSYHGKTGSHQRDNGWGIGWWVGWLVRGPDRYVFATNLKGKGVSGAVARRLTEQALLRAGLLATTRERRLGMDFQEFDQRPEGWRAIGERGVAEKGCCIEAAKLIEEYLARHRSTLASWQIRLLSFHAGQMQAFAGEVSAALSHFRNSYDPADEDRRAPLRWNAYVRATIAFLQRDATTLQACRDAMLSGPKDPAWLTPNLRVVERLIAGLGHQTYAEAYMGTAMSSAVER